MLIEKYPVSKGSILYDFIYITFSIRHNYGDWEKASGCLELDIQESLGGQRTGEGGMCMQRVSTGTSVVTEQLCVLIVVVTQMMYTC